VTTVGARAMRQARVWWLIPLRVLTFAGCVSISFSVGAQPADRCGDILSDALLTQRTTWKKSTTDDVANYLACSASSAEILNMQERGRKDEAKDADGHVGWGKVLRISGKPSILKERNSTDQQIQQWKNDNCTKSGQNHNLSAAAFVAEKF